jgi:hypothetical protein
MPRKVLYTEDRVRALFARMRSDLHSLQFKHLCAIADLKREVDAMRAELAQLRELRAAVLARRQAELASLYREREIALARATERDPSYPLQ